MNEAIAKNIIGYNPDLRIETSRLMLRPPVPSDFDDWVKFHADEEVMKFLGGTQSRPMAWRGFCSYLGSWQFLGFGMFAVVLKETGEWIGRIGPINPEAWPDKEVGWGILSKYSGKGFALESAIASMDYAFDVLGWDNLIHTIAPENFNSQKLAARLGSRELYETKLPDPFSHLQVKAWGQSKSEWQNNKKGL